MGSCEFLSHVRVAFLTRSCQNGRIADGLSLFKKNVTLHFEGQVECAICYSYASFAMIPDDLRVDIDLLVQHHQRDGSESPSKALQDLQESLPFWLSVQGA